MEIHTHAQREMNYRHTRTATTAHAYCEMQQAPARPKFEGKNEQIQTSPPQKLAKKKKTN